MGGDYPSKKRKMESDTIADPPSLQELAIRKALSEILQPSFQDADFENLEPRLQRLLFNKMRSELMRLQNWEESMPQADAYLGTPAAKRKILAPCKEVYNVEGPQGYDFFEDMKAFDEFEGEDEAEYYEQSENPQNGFRQQEYFVRKWDFSDEADSDHGLNAAIAGEPVVWRSIHDVELRGSELVLVEPSAHLTPGQAIRNPVCMGEKHGFSDCISSQLLLYRLTAMFGMPSEYEPPRPEFCWEVYLMHNSEKGFLHLYDEHGAARCKFWGTQEASNDALNLLNYLCSTNIPHPDARVGVVAGVKATREHYDKA